MWESRQGQEQQVVVEERTAELDWGRRQEQGQEQGQEREWERRWGPVAPEGHTVPLRTKFRCSDEISGKG